MSAETVLRTVGYVTAEDLRNEIRDGAEIAVLDIREGEHYASGHISVSVPITDSELELRIGSLVPRASTRIVVVDSDVRIAESAASRLQALGYSNIRILGGGIEEWSDAGFELITGLNSLSKALGEFVERRYHTPRITAEDLKHKIDAGDDLVVLDTRPLPEFTHIAIPTAQAAPGAELLFRVFDQLPSPSSLVVVNCAGRTRAIIGAQALINAGISNPVVALENGTAAWQFAGYEPTRGIDQIVGAPSAEGLEEATAAARRIRDRFGVQEITADDLQRLGDESADRTLYLLDIRTPDEFHAGHHPESSSAPGGQLVQATDRYVGAIRSRVVLVDSTDLVRSSITASWLIQLGLHEVYIYGAEPTELRATGPVSPHQKSALPEVPAITAGQLAQRLKAGEPTTVIDLRSAPAYYEDREYIGDSKVSRRSTLLHNPQLLEDLERSHGEVILVSSTGRLASILGGELVGRTSRPIRVLSGGIGAWIAAGLPVETGVSQTPLTAADALPAQPDLEQKRAVFADYVAWGDQITGQLERDGLVVFRAFEDPSPTAVGALTVAAEN